MQLKAWLHCFGSASHLADVAATLGPTDIVIHKLDPNAPEGLGLLLFDEISLPLCDFLREISRSGTERVLAIAASHSSVNNNAIWQLLFAGASDVLAWDSSPAFAERVTARLQRWDAVDRLVESSLVRNNLIGQSPAWVSVLRSVVEVARYTDDAVALIGESGTGKELAARLIHTLDPHRSKHELVILDCTTIVPELSGSEFFGHERGAFTGAVNARDGAFALANDGTLFLDEIGELPMGLQAQLLRAIQEHTYKRVGSNSWRHTNFRLICATNRDLRQEVADGRFRPDLYYRIASWICKLPTLRERSEDILPLARHFLQELGSDEAVIELDEPVRQYLLKRDYPGNVRDLRQLMTRIGHRHVGPGPITVGDIPTQEWTSDKFAPADWRDARFEQAIRHALALGDGLKEISHAATETAIRVAIGDEEGNLQRAARKLGVTDRALQMRRANRRVPE
jgi:transcriptional regulator with GAF, ATPase, and Fis domain